MARIIGELEPVGNAVLTVADMEAVFDKILDERHKKILEEKGEVDLRYEIPGLAGYRVNVFQTLAGAAAAFREIPLLRMLSSTMRTSIAANTSSRLRTLLNFVMKASAAW